MGRSHGWVGIEEGSWKSTASYWVFFVTFQGAKMLNFKGKNSLIHWILTGVFVQMMFQICGAVFLGGTLQAHRNGIDIPNVSVWIASIMTFDICNHLLTAPHLDLFHLSSNFFIDLQQSLRSVSRRGP